MIGAQNAKRVRRFVRTSASHAAYALSPQCRFRDCIFILAHMRCGSTALSNILCSRPDVSGYGEPHIHFDRPVSLGRLVVNQAVRGEWTPGAPHLFAKNLHSRHDRDPDPGFFEARAIFVTRRPVPTIRSIRTLYSSLGRKEYRTDREAAEYYIERVRTLTDHWERFDSHRRVGLTFDALITDPDAALAEISSRLGINPPLENCYESRAASRRGGAGDPTASGRFTRIEPRSPEAGDESNAALDMPADLLDAAEGAYAHYVEKIVPPRRRR